MKKSETDKVCNFNIKDLFVSQVQYKSCGMTTIYSPKYMSFYIDKRGKAIGGFMLDYLFGEGIKGTKAISFVGSSSLGLEGICGINNELLKLNKNKFHDRAIGACIWSFNIEEKDFTHPDVKLGKYAMKKLKNKVYIGQAGCGVNATVGKLNNDYKKTKVFAGQGAFYLEEGNIKMLCIIILNSIGVVHENGLLLHDFKIDNKNIKKLQDLPKSHKGPKPNNTTLTAFIINMKMNEEEMKNMSSKLHDVVESMIFPYATKFDGDCFFLLSTNEVKYNHKKIDSCKDVVKNAIKSVFV